MGLSIPGLLQRLQVRALKSNSKELISPAYVAWWARTSNKVVVPVRQARNRFLGSLKGLQIRKFVQ
jgi:hypothetical protein